MECTGCGGALTYTGTFGFFNKRFYGDFQKSGDTYKCENEPKEGEEECPSSVHGCHFHTRGNSDELIEGCPC